MRAIQAQRFSKVLNTANAGVMAAPAPATPRRWIRWFRPGIALVLAACAPVLAQDVVDEDEPERDPGYRFLLMESSTIINGKGLKMTRMHNRIEIQKPHAVDAIGDISIPYNAFRSEARVVKAFTQTADGRTVPLKKESVRDLAPDEVSSYQMYTDVHQLTFSMPALGKGAVMDYEVEIEEKKPVMPGEFWASAFLDSSVQVCTSRVTMAFPAKREVRIVATNLAAQARSTDTTNGGTRTLTWEMRDLPALEYEPGMPPFALVRAQVHLTSVKSWQQVEDWYAALAKKQLQADDETRQLARSLIGGLTNQLEQIQALYRYASREVRYVGVELGRSAYEPHPPRETAQNKYGDCKDKAALLVALLGGIGVPAHLAIVRPNYDGPVEQSLPGPQQFDHAIVYVPRPAGDLWIDATQPFGEVTEHGYHLDDVDALVIGLAGKTFVRVPVPDETHSVHRTIFDVKVHYGGLATVHETQEYSGRAAASERERRSRLDAAKVRQQLERTLGSGAGYWRLLDYSFTHPTNDIGPLRVRTDYDSDTFLTPTKAGLSVHFDSAQLRGWLDVPRPDPTAARKHKRLYPWVARTPHTEEIICRLHLPQGYELARTPTETRRTLPQGSAELIFEKSAETPCLTLRVVRRPAQIEPGDLPEVAHQVDASLARVRASLDVEDSINDLLKEHRYAKAESAVAEAARSNPSSADAWLRLGSYYKSVGRAYQARLALEKALGLAPQNPRAYELLADTHSGWWGVPGEGFDRQAALAVYDRALTNIPVRSWVLQRKAQICLLNDFAQGESTNHIQEAEGYFRELLKDDPQSYPGLLGLGEVNRLRRSYDDAEEWYRKAGRAQPDEAGPRAGVWTSMAFAGRDEEAWNALTAYYGPGQQMNMEVLRLATKLSLARQYESAAKLYDRLAEAVEQPEMARKLSRLLRKAQKVKLENYETFFDDSSPEAVARTFAIAGLQGDTNKAARCLAPVVDGSEVARGMRAQVALRRLAGMMTPDYLADIVLAAFEVTKRTLDDGDVEVKLDSSKSAAGALNAYGAVITLQVHSVSNRWQVVATGEPLPDCATFGRLALEALDRGDVSRAVACQTRLADIARRPAQARGRTTLPLAAHLQDISFTNDAIRVKAWAGAGLLASDNRADLGRAAACLQAVSAAYPEDAQLKLACATVQRQLANVKQAAAILAAIDLSKVAAPDQLVELGWLQIHLEQIEAADQTVARLREVAPDSEQLLLLQAEAQSQRGKHAEAVTTLAKLRDRSALDSRLGLLSECQIISRECNPATLRDFVERWREPAKPIPGFRPSISGACLSLGLADEAGEQIATMLAEGGMGEDASVGYATVALARGDAPESRYFVGLAERMNQGAQDSPRATRLAQAHLTLGNYTEAARIYRATATNFPSPASAYLLCLSAIASRLADDANAVTETLKLATAMQGDADWPRLAIQYIGGEIPEAELRRAPERTTSTPLMRASRECEVNCFIGLLREAKHDIPGAIAAYQASLATKSVGDNEYAISQLALKRLQKPKQP